MKAISLWQPWASLWCSPAKVHETRKFPTKKLGWIAVHAAKRRLQMDPPIEDVVIHHFGADPLPLGCVVGLIELVDCRRIDARRVGAAVLPETDEDRLLGDWTEGRYAWRRGRFVLLPHPIRWVGQQGWFDVNDAIVRRFVPQ